jgi:hypothetical protein
MRYDCFVLRIWRSEGELGEQWAGRLEHLSGPEIVRFGDPETLLEYLRQHIARDGERTQPIRDDGSGP